MSIRSIIASLTVGAVSLFALPSDAQAQTKYFVRQPLPGGGAGTSSAAQPDPTYYCPALQQYYIAAYSGGQHPAFAASSPSDAQAKCNATKSPGPGMVLNLCVYTGSQSTFGPGLNAMAVWQAASNTDHSQVYAAGFTNFYSSTCVRK